MQILEVSRERAKQYGLNLSAYAIGVHLLARSGADGAVGNAGTLGVPST